MITRQTTGRRRILPSADDKQRIADNVERIAESLERVVIALDSIATLAAAIVAREQMRRPL